MIKFVVTKTQKHKSTFIFILKSNLGYNNLLFWAMCLWPWYSTHEGNFLFCQYEERCLIYQESRRIVLSKRQRSERVFPMKEMFATIFLPARETILPRWLLVECPLANAEVGRRGQKYAYVQIVAAQRQRPRNQDVMSWVWIRSGAWLFSHPLFQGVYLQSRVPHRGATICTQWHFIIVYA